MDSLRSDPPLPPPPPPSSTTLYVSRFHDFVSARQLGEVFEEYGQLAKVKVVPNQRGPYAFVVFRREEDMRAVLKDYKEGRLLGHVDMCTSELGLHCEVSRPRSSDTADRPRRMEKRARRRRSSFENDVPVDAGDVDVDV